MFIIPKQNPNDFLHFSLFYVHVFSIFYPLLQPKWTTYSSNSYPGSSNVASSSYNVFLTNLPRRRPPILSIPLDPKNYRKPKNFSWYYLPHKHSSSFPPHFIMKMFKHTAKLKEFYNEYQCTHHLNSTITMLLPAWHITIYPVI